MKQRIEPKIHGEPLWPPLQEHIQCIHQLVASHLSLLFPLIDITGILQEGILLMKKSLWVSSLIAGDERILCTVMHEYTRFLLPVQQAGVESTLILTKHIRT